MAEILFVGTGDAFGSGGRRNTAILIHEGSQLLLLDCGPTTLAGLKTLGIDPTEIDAVVLTHFHGDHCGGVPFLLLDYAFEARRDRPLQILGPSGVESWIDGLAKAFAYESIRECCYPLAFREYSCGKVTRLGGLSITPLPAYHTPNTRPHMLRVQTDRHTIVFSGDTGWYEELPEHVAGADLFICECQFLEDEAFEFHLCHRQLAAVKDRLRSSRTLLTHMGGEVLSRLDELVFEAARDGLKIKL